MQGISPKSNVVSFGAFDVSLPTQEVFKHGTRIKLPPQAFRVLQMLLENSGQLVTREEFHKALWSDDTFVDFDQGLNNAIRKIRDALNDSAEKPRFVETLPKLGYRFVAKIIVPANGNGAGGAEALVQAVGNGLVASAVAGPAGVNGHEEKVAGFDDARADDLFRAAAGRTRIVRRGPKSTMRWTFVAGVAALGLVVVAGVVQYGVHLESASKAALEFVPFTTMPGQEGAPTFSPDGEEVAFDYLSDAGWSIYIKRLDGETMVQLTEPSDLASCPAWSPDGKLISYLKGWSGSALRTRSGIYLMTPMGGEKRKLLNVTNVSCNVAWSPDSRTLVYGPAWSETEPPGLFLVDIDNPVPRRLLTSPPNTLDAGPSFSHNGKWIAFARNTSLGVMDLYVVASTGGEPKRLTHINANLGGAVWTSDDQRIVFWSGSGWTTALYSVSASGGTPQRLPLGTHNIGSPAISQDGSKLMFLQAEFDPNIWRINLGAKRSVPEKLISSTWFENAPDYSPDGSRIAFLSDRDGTQAIWICGADGSHPRRLDLRGPTPDTAPQRPNVPKWAPSGDLIAFDALADGHRQIFIVDADGGVARQLTTGEFENQVPSWSADGQWIYFGSDRTGRYEVWKTSLKTRETKQITHQGGYFAQESADRKFVLFSKPEKQMATWTYVIPGIYSIPSDGVKEKLLIPGAEWYWRVTKSGVYFADNATKPRPVLKVFHPETGKTETVATLDKPAWGAPTGITLSPDGHTFLYAQIDAEDKDLMLVRNGNW